MLECREFVVTTISVNLRKSLTSGTKAVKIDQPETTLSLQHLCGFQTYAFLKGFFFGKDYVIASF